MRFRRFLSGLLFGLGCALAFIGLLTIVLPAIPNPQLKLVLASFSMPSDNGIVRMMNRFMTFSLEQNWRMLGLGALIAAMGMWLLIHFTPKQQNAPMPSQPKDIQPVSSEPIMQPEPEAANPFAVEASPYAVPAKPQAKTNSFVVHAQPILERNKIEETAEVSETLSVGTTPYYSPRFEAESRAIQTEVGAASQSGSRILVRSVYESPAPAEMPVADEPVKMDIPKAEPSVPPAPAPMPPLSPRIRSTMGRHGTIKRNLPAPRP